MKIENISIDQIKPYENNPRINVNAVEKVKKSIKTFGFQIPIVLDRDFVIICGHTRFQAAQLLGYKTLPCIIAIGLTEAEAKAYRIADNRTQDNSEWDYDLLPGEMELLKELGVDLSETGFQEGEIEEILGMIDSSVAKTGELDLDDFGDDTFDYKCPCCGFRWQA